MINLSTNIEMHAFSSIWLQNYYTLMRHVNNIPTMHFFHWKFQKYPVKIIYAIID